MSGGGSTFMVEYAKSDRSKCKNCHSTIDKDSFRFAILVQSSKFDGKVPNWYHTDCFFKKVKLIDAKIIKGFDDLRWEDQEKIRKLIENNSTLLSNENDPNEAFVVEYAKSNRSRCHGCDQSIDKDTVRLSRKNFTSRRARRYGPVDQWFHLNCFHQMKKDLSFFGTAESFSGFVDLNKEDQLELKEKFGSSTISKRKRKGAEMNNQSTTPKQAKVEDNSTENIDEQEETRRRKEQSEVLWNSKDNLRKDIPQNVLKELIEYNNQKPISGESNLIEAVTDCMTFGALEPCPQCGGFLVFNYTNYRCTGNLTEWTKCTYSTQLPQRKPFQIPDNIKDNYPIFQNYQYTKQDRILTQINNKPKLGNTTKKIEEPDYDPKLPLNGYSVALVGRLSKRPSTLKKQIEDFGGKFLSNIAKTVDVIISTSDEIQSGNKKLDVAQKFDIHIVPEEFLNDILNDRPSNVMEKIKLSTWGILPHIRKQFEKKSRSTYKSSNRSKGFIPDKVTMKLKDGAAVNPDSGLEETCHVLKDNETGDIYTAVLGMVDITCGTNSYYKIQLLEDDNGNSWHLFRGRTGTTFGSKKIDKFDKKSKAIQQFNKIFYDKTGNEWNLREGFKKMANKLYPLEIDYGQNDDQLKQTLNDTNSNSRSLLPSSVQDLIRLIFNVESMENILLSFEIDLNKMPLGKLSKNQLNKAYQVLTELQTLIDNNNSNKNLFLDASNRFYTLIPHDFGLRKPIIIDKIDLIKSKTQMIDNLLEIEIAYSLLKGTDNDKNQNPIDIHYQKLKCLIEPIDENTEEFERIETYMINTHAKTHNQYSLKIKQLFKIQREGEYDKFKQFQKNKNRQLLWHGSRTTNFAGILSQGLRIAPPEAPMTGYMFGKGVYFADMVSKSANYCFTKRESPEGLMVLCEVALGNMHECNKAATLSAETLPSGTLSTKGCGQTIPDPKENFYTEDRVLIPLGHPINANMTYSSLLYNEYIVYNTDQIKIKYLLWIDFHFKD